MAAEKTVCIELIKGRQTNLVNLCISQDICLVATVRQKGRSDDI